MKMTFNIEKRIEKNGKVIENNKAIKRHSVVIDAISKIVACHLDRKLTSNERDEIVEYVETLA